MSRDPTIFLSREQRIYCTQHSDRYTNMASAKCCNLMLMLLLFWSIIISFKITIPYTVLQAPLNHNIENHGPTLSYSCKCSGQICVSCILNLHLILPSTDAGAFSCIGISFRIIASLTT